MDAQGGKQSAGHQGTCDDGAQDSVAVVEEEIGGGAFPATGEVGYGGEDGLPVEGGGSSLHVFGVAAFHFTHPTSHVLHLFSTFGGEDRRLVGDFLLHGLLPELFLQG